MASKRQFTLSTDIQETDWARLYVIMYKAFVNSPETRVLYPGGLDPAYREEYANRMKNEIRYGGGGTTTKLVAKITDQASGEILSYISGIVYRGPLGLIDSHNDDGKTLAPIKLPMIEDAKEREFYEWYWTTRRTALRTEVEQMWIPNLYIRTLCTDPAWQRHGAASMLVHWIMDLSANQEKIERCTLTASRSALKTGFYGSFGFRTVYEKEVEDKSRFPDMRGNPLVVMISDLTVA